jgi:hypothetical protein
MPASVAASAAPIERLPERHRNTTGRSPGVTPASCSWATNASLWLPSVRFHSMNRVSRSSSDRSGTPTKVHSAEVRQSTSTASGFSLSSCHASCGVMSPA